MEQFSYYAFISYSTADEKWAKWLHNHLESYVIPSKIRKGNLAIPKKVQPVFWYKTDLSGVQLHNALDKELAASKYLIVICSPHSARSEWVNDEIKAFIRSGRADKIIPFIVEGSPDAADAGNCFAPVLRELPREQSLRGIDVNKEGREHALVDVVATMFGLRFDALWQRQKRKKARQRILYSIMGLLALCLAIFLWDYNRSIVEYYDDYIDCYGIPEGIRKLSKEDFRHREHSWRFRYERVPFGHPKAYSWRLAEVTNVNSANIPQEYQNTQFIDRQTMMELVYNSSTGNLSHVNFKNRNGQQLYRYIYSDFKGQKACIVDIEGSSEDHSQGFATIKASAMSGDDAKGSSPTITRLVYHRDSRGHITRITYHCNNDYNIRRSLTADMDGAFGIDCRLDSKGRPLRITYLGEDLKPCPIITGLAYKLYSYSSKKFSCSYHLANDSLMFNEHEWAKLYNIYDIYGNCVEEYYVEDGEKPCLRKGFAKKRWEYDEHGYLIENSYVGLDGKPCLNEDGVTKYIYKNDSHGNFIESTCLGIDGKTCLNEDGVAKYTYKYDSHGNIIERAFYGIDGKPCLNEYDVAKCVFRYDSRGNIIEEAVYGVDGKPCLNEYDVAKYLYKYDVRGNRIETAYFGIKGKPCLCSNGYAEIRCKYDSRGNIIEEAFYGVDGKPCLNEDGVAKYIYKYDARGNRIETAYFGINGKPCLDGDGVARRVFKYNARGNCIETAFFGINGKPCFDEDGVAKYGAKYDSRGNIKELTRMGIDGKPCLDEDGVAKYGAKYDSRGNIIEETYFDINGKIVLSSSGYAGIRYKYDDLGDCIEEAYFDINGKPCLNANGHAGIKRKYDAHGICLEESLY